LQFSRRERSNWGPVWGCFAEDGENGEGIDACVADPYGPVKMRPRHSSRCANLPDDLACGHAIASMHVNDRQVGEQRKHSEPMIDDDGIPGEVQLAGHDHPAAVRGLNRRACGAEEIGSPVWLASLAIEDAPRAEDAGRPPWNRTHERCAP
jgi:hypothetical protein